MQCGDFVPYAHSRFARRHRHYSTLLCLASCNLNYRIATNVALFSLHTSSLERLQNAAFFPLFAFWILPLPFIRSFRSSRLIVRRSPRVTHTFLFSAYLHWLVVRIPTCSFLIPTRASELDIFFSFLYIINENIKRDFRGSESL